MPKILLPYYDVYAPAPSAIPDELLIGDTEVTGVGEPYIRSIHANKYTSDGDPAYQGIMGVANGYLDTHNLGPETLIQDRHVMPEQAALARMESLRSSNTVFGNSSGTTSEDDADQYFKLPGLGLRWYQPYEASFALCQWSFFVSYNSWMGRYKDALSNSFTKGVFTTVRLRCTLDGEALPHTERVLGENFFHPVSPAANNPWNVGDGDEELHESSLWGPGLDIYDNHGTFSTVLGGGNPRYISPEAHTATYFDLHHVIGNGAKTFLGGYAPISPGSDAFPEPSNSATLAKGYHEIGVECSIDVMQTRGGTTSGPVFVQSLGKATAVDDYKTNEFRMRGHFNLTGKLSLGVRNARVMSFL